jgi:hypothetical protein
MGLHGLPSLVNLGNAWILVRWSVVIRSCKSAACQNLLEIPKRRFVLWIAFLEGRQALFRATGIKSEVLEIHDLCLVRIEHSVDLTAAWPGLWIDGNQTFNSID